LVILSSGTHGAEGYLGSAVQLALMNRLLAESLPPDVGLGLIHAVNPFGFSMGRRVNEDNIDLNRNFLLPGEPFSGLSAAYQRLDRWLNGPLPVPSIDLFPAAATIERWRNGPNGVLSLAVGQYERPKGVYYGGAKPAASQRILRKLLERWTRDLSLVVHVDYHTGAGPWGEYVLPICADESDDDMAWLGLHFGADKLNRMNPDKVLYRVRGALIDWCRALHSDIEYHALVAEFGTYARPIMFKAMRRENRAYHWRPPQSPSRRRSRDELLEVFTPRDRPWRDNALRTGLRVAEQAISAAALRR